MFTLRHVLMYYLLHLFIKIKVNQKRRSYGFSLCTALYFPHKILWEKRSEVRSLLRDELLKLKFSSCFDNEIDHN